MVKTVGYGGRRHIQDVRGDEDGRRRWRVIERFWARGWYMWKDHVRVLIANARPITLKPSDSQDSQTSRIELQISDNTGNNGEQSLSKSPAKSSVLSTSEKRNSRFNTPIPVNIPPSSPSSPRDGNHSQSLPVTACTRITNNTRSANIQHSSKEHGITVNK